MPHQELFLLGPFQVKRDGSPVTSFEADKVRALLAYLAVESSRPHRREQLAALFWPGWPDTSARTSLRNALSNLRKAIGDETANPPFLLISRETIQFNPESSFSLDTRELERITKDSHAAPEQLQSVLDHYRGAFLEGFTLKDCPVFDDWSLAVREQCQSQVSALLSCLAELFENDKAYEKAIACTRQRLALEPWQEDAHRQLMRLLAASGQRPAALVQFEACKRNLMSELGVEPSAETVKLYKSIRDSLPSELAPAKARLHNLPIQLTSFVGRQEETQAVLSLLEKNRLVTLTGSGGCGKTRLGLNAAAQLTHTYPDGVWYVELAPLSDPNRVPAAVARAIGLVESAQQPIQEKLLIVLQDSRMLLMLDNCEHLIESCAHLCSTILRTCPGVVILATSREALEIEGERAFRVPSLPTPGRDQAPDLEAVRQYAAIHLFEARAEAALPGFLLTREDLPAVMQVCACLDGIPLAIELAAARVKLLRVKEIAQRLDNRFRLLTGGARSALPRQQTLRACIDWSYALLSEYERHLLQRLSVFAGGWTLEAAEAVCGEECLQPEDVLDALEQLVNKSLVQVERKLGQEARYSLLETIRQYGHEKLVEAGEADQVRQRHLAYYVRLAEQAELQLRGPQEGAWLGRLQAELDNLRLALEWSLVVGSDPDWWPEEGIRLVCASFWFWHARELWAEAASWLECLLEAEQRQKGQQPLRADVNPNRIAGRARALQNLGKNWIFLGFQGHSTSLTAEAVSEESRGLYQQLGMAGRHGLAGALFNLGCIKENSGDLNQSESLFQESIHLFKEGGDRFNTAECLNWLGYLAHDKNNIELAKQYFEQSLELRREIGDRDAEGGVLIWLGWMNNLLGDSDKAYRLLLEGIHIYDEFDIRIGKIIGLEFLGQIAWDGGRYQQALDWFDQAVQAPHQRGRIGMFVDGQLWKARVALSQGDYDQALTWIQDSLETGRKWNYQGWIIQALVELGQHSWAIRQYSQAKQRYSEALSIAKSFDLRYDAAITLCGLGKTALMLGDLTEARGYLTEALRYLLREMGGTDLLAWNLQYVIMAAIQAQQMAQAARLLAATEVPFNRYKNRYLPADRQIREDNLTKVRLALGEESFAAAFCEGTTMTEDQAYALALELCGKEQV
jgi:predicted ATPase/DNA-binding SARP family transcriptional activator